VKGRGTLIAASIVVASVLLLVILAVLALASVLHPIR
jgi:hypothetical protein